MELTARELLIQLYQAAIDAVDGRFCVQQWCRDNPAYEPQHVIAIGKAAPAMLQGMLDCKPQIQSALLITTPQKLPREFKKDKRVQTVYSAHPVPDETSLQAGETLLQFIRATPENTELLFLISGGASSLVEVMRHGYQLQQLQTINQYLLASGKAIHAINAWRKQVSAIKGGGLLDFIGDRRCMQLLISDVKHDDVAVIGSGLLVTAEQAPDADGYLSSICEPVTLKPSHQPIDSSVIATLNDALRAAQQQASLHDVDCTLHQEFIEGEAAEQGGRLAAKLKHAPPGIHIFGGETTVTLPDKPGIGGRNQTLALAISVAIEGEDICVLCAGTDGIDGNTPCAGAMISGTTATTARKMGFDIEQEITNANAGTVLMATGDLYKPGATPTNVMDIIIAYKRS